MVNPTGPNSKACQQNSLMDHKLAQFEIDNRCFVPKTLLNSEGLMSRCFGCYIQDRIPDSHKCLVVGRSYERESEQSMELHHTRKLGSCMMMMLMRDDYEEDEVGLGSGIGDGRRCN